MQNVIRASCAASLFQTHQLFTERNEPDLLISPSLHLNFSQYVILFFKSLINADIFFTSGIGTDSQIFIKQHIYLYLWSKNRA